VNDLEIAAPIAFRLGLGYFADLRTCGPTNGYFADLAADVGPQNTHRRSASPQRIVLAVDRRSLFTIKRRNNTYDVTHFT